VSTPITISVDDQQATTADVTYTDAESTYSQLFPVIPAASDPDPPDISQLAIADDLADFAADEQQNDTGAPVFVPLAVKSVVMNWDTEELYQSTTGSPLVVEDEDTVIGALLLISNTLPGTYSIFTPGFGNQVLDLEGLPMSSASFASEVARLTQESFSTFTMVTDVEIEAVQRFPAVDPNALFVTVAVGTVFSEELLQFNIAQQT
jgi:hypothetical protein